MLVLVAALVATALSSTVYYRENTNLNIIARKSDQSSTLIPDNPLYAKILGFTVHEAVSKLYWSDGNAIWRSFLNGTSSQIYIGGIVQVTWNGKNFGYSPQDLTLSVEGTKCVSILSWSPTKVSCIMTRPSRTLSMNDISIDSVMIQTNNGQTQGIHLDYDALVSTLGYTMPLVKSIDIQIALLNPHTLAIDNTNLTERWLYFSDATHGSIYRADTTSSAVALLVDHAWNIHGLAVYGSSLYISSESNGTISLFDTLSNSSTTILTNLHSPRGLVVDRLNSTLYFVEKGGKIFMAKTTGKFFYSTSRAVYTQVHRLVGGNTLSRLNGISLSSDGYLYWSESNTNVIARMSLTSYNRQVLLGPPQVILSWPRHVYIAASNDVMYYTEYPGRISSWTLSSQSTTNVVNQVIVASSLSQVDQLLQMHSNQVLFYALE